MQLDTRVALGDLNGISFLLGVGVGVTATQALLVGAGVVSFPVVAGALSAVALCFSLLRTYTIAEGSDDQRKEALLLGVKYAVGGIALGAAFGVFMSHVAAYTGHAARHAVHHPVNTPGQYHILPYPYPMNPGTL